MLLACLVGVLLAQVMAMLLAPVVAMLLPHVVVCYWPLWWSCYWHCSGLFMVGDGSVVIGLCGGFVIGLCGVQVLGLTCVAVWSRNWAVLLLVWQQLFLGAALLISHCICPV